MLYEAIAFLLRFSPIVTIPALSLSYLFQIGCEELEFKAGAYVCWFILGKSFCYVLCAWLARCLARHVKIEVPFEDNQNILDN
ncbi:MAG: hypothetical protein IJT88_01145 [Kiritimatiellae bacterium]|nr:hypothetical protein [Kiritimatiellia bacterium]